MENNLLDIQQKEINKKRVKFWKFETSLLNLLHIIQYILLLCSAPLLLGLFNINIPNNLIWLPVVCLIFAFILQFVIGFWEIVNAFISLSLDKKNTSMRLKYLTYACSCLLMIFVSIFITLGFPLPYFIEKLLVYYFIIILAIVPHIISLYYIKTLQKSIENYEE